MSDFTVTQHGVDSSGRAIFLTNYMADWFEGVVDELGWRPVIIQGAFMSRVPGGGAKDSSGYHDLGGCIDVRTRDLTKAKIDALVRITRDRGAGSWRRDETQRHGGMTPHCHITLGSDAPLSSGARTSWQSYLSNGDGLAGPGSDYEYRPDPLVLTPPEDAMKDEDFDRIQAMLDAQRTSIVKDIFATAIDKAGTTFKAAVRKAAGLVK